MNLLKLIKKSKQDQKTLTDYWGVESISPEGMLHKKGAYGYIFELDGIDGSFLTLEQTKTLHQEWRSTLRLDPGEEIQVVFRKRVEFSKWVEKQLNQTFMSKSLYGRKLLLDRLAKQIAKMSEDEPSLLSQRIIVCYWSATVDSPGDKKNLIAAQLQAFGFKVKVLNKTEIESEISQSAQDLSSSELHQPEWPSLSIKASELHIGDDNFRALELTRLPESYTELGMIQAITKLPYPMDVSVRLRAKDEKPIVSRLERKRNLLNAQKANQNSPAPALESQMEQIDSILRSLTENSESIYKLNMTIGLRMPQNLKNFQSRALAQIMRSSSQMDFCELSEATLNCFDSYLECIPSFTGKNLHEHTVLSSNAIHFLPFFRPAKGDAKAIASFQSIEGNLYGINPVDHKLANYNWLVSGTSGSGKSFFVNSLLAQSASLNPNIFIVDIGGSYNKLTEFLGGKVKSLEPGQGFELSPFFLPKSKDPQEEKLRRQHIFHIFLEMIRIDGQNPTIEMRHMLAKSLEKLYELENLPAHPISSLINEIAKNKSKTARQLSMALEQWGNNSFYGQFLDNNKVSTANDKILTFDLKGLNEFEDLSRVVQLIVCADLWARIRNANKECFSWIVLDEVAFSLLKTQPQFVDELVSTLRKYYAGAIVVVQDLEKVTSNLAGSSILQNTQSKAILQQRGNPKNYADYLNLNQVDLWAISSLQRKKAYYSDVFLIRDNDKTIIRHIPSDLEYWVSTSAPEDNHEFRKWTKNKSHSLQKNIVDFVNYKREAAK